MVNIIDHNKDLNKIKEEEKEEEPNEFVLLYEFIEDLDETNKLIVILRFFGFTYKEISNKIGISTKTVGRRLRKVLAATAAGEEK